MKGLLVSILTTLFLLFVSIFSYTVGKHHVYYRCMKYFGNAGYPASGYCKLFVGDIKARDE